MKNVTITLDEETVTLAKREAARQNLSLSRYVSDLLRHRIQESRQYEIAMRRCLARKPVRLRGRDQPYPKRDEIYDRAGIR